MPSPEYSVFFVDPNIGGGHMTAGMAVEPDFTKIGVGTRWLNPNSLSRRARLTLGTFRFAYEKGSQPIVRPTYEEVRGSKNQDSFLVKTVRDSVGHTLRNHEGPVIATHSFVAARTEGPLVVLVPDVEAPPDAAVKHADFVAVTTDIAKRKLLFHGLPENQIRQVGFFVDERILTAKEMRMEQLIGNERLHVGIFFSGALPGDHIDLAKKKLLPELFSLIQDKKMAVRISIYTFTNNRLANEFIKIGRQKRLKTVAHYDDAPDSDWDVRVIWGNNPREAIENSIAAVSDPNNPVGLLVTMANERIGWLAGDLPQAFLWPVNEDTSGRNTRWAVTKGLALDPNKTPYLATYIGEGKNIIFREQVKKARDNEALDPNGGRNTVIEIEKLMAA